MRNESIPPIVSRPRCEPKEQAFAVNDLLDSIERDVRAAIAAGAESPLVARLTRLLPALKGS